MNQNKRKVISLVCNIIIVIMEIIALILSIIKSGLGIFKMYTQDSNLLLLITCALFSTYQILNFKKGIDIPKIVSTLKYISTCMVTITLLIVLLVLIPMAGFNTIGYMLFDGSMLFHHTLCPILAIISFVFFDEMEISKKETLYAFLPTLGYGFVMVILNLVRVVEGPYGFLYVYQNPVYVTIIWGIVLLGFAYLISLFFKFIKNKCNNKLKK